MAEWRALDAVVRPESGWNPCAVYGYRGSVCWYSGSNSCGIPQRDPCPLAWRGRLWVTRWAQVRTLISYVAGRYGDPLHALWFREAKGWY